MDTLNPYVSPPAPVVPSTTPETRSLRWLANLSWRVPLYSLIPTLGLAIASLYVPGADAAGMIVLLLGAVVGMTLAIVALAFGIRHRQLLRPALAGLLVSSLLGSMLLGLVFVIYQRNRARYFEHIGQQELHRYQMQQSENSDQAESVFAEGSSPD